MNFFQAQERAKRNTSYLLFLFALAVIFLIAITILFLAIVFLYSSDISLAELIQNPTLFISKDLIIGVGVVVLGVVGLGSLYKYFSLSSGGKAVALSLGGELLTRNTAKGKEQVLLNVVDEMAIASGISTPDVYVLKDDSINAFAAGFSFDDAVIGVTQGCINRLNRDEIQGVIAHEFSHIFNADMKLNLNLVAILHGILLIGLIGKFMFRSVFYGNHYKHNSDGSKKNNSALYLLAVGGGLMAIGYGGTLLGNLIKASVSRNREYLADATAVQYTRYPDGIANALKKIGYYSSAISSPGAETYSHFYFASALSSLFATHPPLATRIRRIDRSFNGNYEEALGKLKSDKDKRGKIKSEKRAKAKDYFSKIAVASVISNVGSVDEEVVEDVSKQIKELPQSLKDRVDEPLGAQAILLALVYNSKYKVDLFHALHEANPHLLNEFTSLLDEEHYDINKYAHILVELSLKPLKSLSLEQYKVFKKLMKLFIDADKMVSIYEWSVFYNIARPLEINLGIHKIPKALHSHLGSVKKEVEVLYSMLAYNQSKDDTLAKDSFDQTKKEIKAGALEYINSRDIKQTDFLNSVKELERLKPPIQLRVFEGLLYLVKLDKKISIVERNLLHALSKMMQIPLNLA